MFRKILTIVLTLGIALALPNMALATDWDKACDSNTYLDSEVAEAAGCNETDTEKEDLMSTTVAPIINTVLGLVGVISVVVIVVAGINLTTAGGDPGKIAKARFALLYAIIGLVIALLAFAIVNFAITGAFG